MSKKAPVYYWDSCCFIDLLQKTPGRIDELEAIRKTAEQGKAVIATSSLTLAEVVKTDSGGVSDQDEALIAKLFSEPYIKVRLLDRPTATEARSVHRSLGLKPPDCIHVATAVLANATELHTYDDKRLLKKDGQYGNPGLRIVRPRPGQLALAPSQEEGIGITAGEPADE